MSRDAQAARRREAMLAAILRRLEGCRTIAVGASSPLPGTAALLARAKWGARVLMLGSRRHNSFTDGGRELFDIAAQDALTRFFCRAGRSMEARTSTCLASAATLTV